jgi:hypothetical protein
MNIDTTIANPSEQNELSRKTQPKPEHQTTPERLVDKFAEARRAKKKEKRVRHRAKLRRSHTDG